MKFNKITLMLVFLIGNLLNCSAHSQIENDWIRLPLSFKCGNLREVQANNFDKLKAILDEVNCGKSAEKPRLYGRYKWSKCSGSGFLYFDNRNKMNRCLCKVNFYKHNCRVEGNSRH